MSRRPNLIPSVQLNLALPLDTHTKLTAHLYSELEGRVPLGAYQRFLVERIREYFHHEHLDLAPWSSVDSGLLIVSGDPLTITHLKKVLAHE